MKELPDFDRTLYFDYAAATPVDPRVIDVMSKCALNCLGSSYAMHHKFGQSISDVIEESRRQVAACIHADTDEIVFTSSATESNNIAILGLAQHLKKTGKTHIITHALEHLSVLGPIEHLRKIEGFSVSIVPAQRNGILDVEYLKTLISSHTGLISLQSVNNELGTLQPLKSLAHLTSRNGIILHTDAAQALSRTPFSVTDPHIDMATISAQKSYGPAGIAALYVRKGTQPFLSPLLKDGGAHDLRPGALSPTLCAGFGLACSFAQFSEKEHARLEKLRFYLLHTLKEDIPDLVTHGSDIPEERVPGIISLRIPGISSETLMTYMSNVAFGVARYLTPDKKERMSHMISAVTDGTQATRETIRISFGRFTKKENLEQLTSSIIHCVNKERGKNDSTKY